MLPICKKILDLEMWSNANFNAVLEKKSTSVWLPRPSYRGVGAEGDLYGPTFAIGGHKEHAVYHVRERRFISP